MPNAINDLPDEYKARGWRIEHEGYGWVRAVNANGKQTRSHYPAKHRGLKFVLRDIDKIEKETNDASR